MGFGKKRSKNVGVGAITTNKKKLFAEGGMMDDGKSVDPVSGNDVPTGSLAEEVRDDVDAKLSPGEFVFPADVVRFIGLERLMKMRDEAKQGLARMNDIGQMGNAEDVGEASDDSFEEDDDFESEIDGILKEVDQEETGRQTEMAFNAGGFVNPSYYDIEKAPKNPALDIRYFNDAQGKQFYMPFINGKPMKPMPNGAVQTSGPAPKTTGGDGGGGGFDTGANIGGAATVIGGTAITDNTGGTRTDNGAGGVGGNEFITGTYTGSNIKDFGNPTMIYNPGFSGPGGELMPDDLWQNSVSKWQVNIGSAALSTLASAMGVPGILTMGLRAATNKYGVDAVNNFFARANQEDAAKAGGIDLKQPDGVAAAASQIDTLMSMPLNQTANTAGVTGTGGYAASISSTLADKLNAAGLPPEQVGAATQAASDAYTKTKDVNAAVEAAQKSLMDNGVSPDYAKTIDLKAPVETRDLSGADLSMPYEAPAFDRADDTGFNMPYEAPAFDNFDSSGVDFWNFDSFSSGCVDPLVPIYTSPTETKSAKDIAIGDFVYTVHEKSLEKGQYEVVDAKIIKQPKLIVTFDDGSDIKVSDTHKFLLSNGQWKQMNSLDVGAEISTLEEITGKKYKTITNIQSIGLGDVVLMTVKDAHTYVADGLISHNIKSADGYDGFDFGGGGGGGGFDWSTGITPTVSAK